MLPILMFHEKFSSMLQAPYLKIVFAMFLSMLMIYELDLVYEQQSSFICEETDESNYGQEWNLSPEKANHSYEPHQYFFHGATTNILHVYQHLVDLSYSQTEFCKYVRMLSSSQIRDVLRQMRVGNLTSRKSQENFLRCTGMRLLRKLRGKKVKCKHLNSSLSIPQSCQHCKNMSFQSSGPVVALASFAGSGNSWVRQILESATGIYTGAMYCDSSYINAGMIGEGVDTNNVIAIKAHYVPSFVKKLLNNDKAIYIIRSPFGAILSEHNRNIAKTSKKYKALGDSHIVEVNYKYANNPAWDAHVKKKSRSWKSDVMQWLSYKQFPILIVGYENLRRDTYTELKRMLDFLGYPYSEEDVLCTVRNSGEAFHRKHTRKDLQPFSRELQKFVLNEIKQVDDDLLKHNISLYHPY